MSKFYRNKHTGFTLLEILLVVGIVAVLAGIVIIAINPNRQLKSVRDVERKSDIGEVNKAMIQFYIDHGYYPASTTLTTTPTEVCNTGSDSPAIVACGDLIDLSELVPVYVTSIPVDPSVTDGAQGAGYKVAKTPNPPKLYVEASNTELNGTDDELVNYIGPIPAGYTPPSVGEGGGDEEVTCDSGEVDIGSVCYANVSLWLDASDADTITTNGSLVTDWTDKSSNGNDASQSDADLQPTLVDAALGGLDVVRLPYDKRMDTSISGFPVNDDSRTIFIVFTSPTPEGRRMIYTWGWVAVGDNNRAYGILPWTSGSSQIAIHGGNHDIGAGSYSAGSSYVISNIYDSTSGAIKLWLNGTATLNTTTYDFDTDSAAEGGSGRVGGSNWWDENRTIDLGEIIIFDEALTSDQINTIESYLGDKWGISVS